MTKCHFTNNKGLGSYQKKIQLFNGKEHVTIHF